MDTSAGACSVALWNDGATHERLVEMSRGHAEALLPLVLAALRDGDCGFQQLDLLAVTVGPGGFTGIRVGLAAARGMALATGLPCIGISTLEAIASAGSCAARDVSAGGWPLLVAIDSKRGDVYAQLFADGEPATPAVVLGQGDLADHFVLSSVLVAGDAAPSVSKALAAAGVNVCEARVPGFPTAARVAALAARKWQTEPSRRLPLPSPVYLRPPATGPCSGGPEH